jgi:hypothetical protein
MLSVRFLRSLNPCVAVYCLYVSYLAQTALVITVILDYLLSV